MISDKEHERICAEKDAAYRELDRHYADELADGRKLRQQLSESNKEIGLRYVVIEQKKERLLHCETALSEANAELSRLRDGWFLAESNLNAAKDKIAMQREALNRITSENLSAEECADIARPPLSASAESVAAWKAEKLEPLRRQIATLLHVGEFGDDSEWFALKQNLQATAEAYDRELTEPLKKRIAELEAKK